MSKRKQAKSIPCSICGLPYEQYRAENTAHAVCVREQNKKDAINRRLDRIKGKEPKVKAEDVSDKVKLAAVEREYIRLRKAHTLKEAIGDRLVQAIGQIPDLLPPITVNRPVKAGLDEEEIWLDISDCQIGSKGNEEDTGGLSSYGYEKFLERLERWKNAILRIVRYHPNKLRVLNLAFLGDIVDGSQIFESQMRQVEEGGAQQVMFGVEHWARAINELSAYFEVVNCYGVVGNHGRIGKKGVSWIMDNLEFILYHWLEDRLKNNAKVHWEIPNSFWMVVERMGHRHLLVHGDRGIRGWSGIPFYGVKRYKAAMHELLRNTFDINAPFEYVHMGHFSQLASFEDTYMNGSWDAGTELSVAEMVSGGLAHQWMLGLHPTFGVSWARRIWLLDPKNKKKMPLYRGKP